MLKFFSALTNLAESILGLSATVRAVDVSLKEAHANLRVNLALDPTALPAVEQQGSATTEEPKKGRGGKAAA